MKIGEKRTDKSRQKSKKNKKIINMYKQRQRGRRNKDEIKMRKQKKKKREEKDFVMTKQKLKQIHKRTQNTILTQTEDPVLALNLRNN